MSLVLVCVGLVQVGACACGMVGCGGVVGCGAGCGAPLSSFLPDPESVPIESSSADEMSEESSPKEVKLSSSSSSVLERSDGARRIAVGFSV